MLAVDLHAHTRFFHAFPGRPTPVDPLDGRLLGWFARRYALDGVALTNHDYYAPLELAVPTVPGIEISTDRGHVLVVGPDPPTRTDPGELSPEAAVELAHDRGCAAVLAHPFRNSTALESDAAFDAVEYNGKHRETHSRVEALADRRDLPVVAGSDAHYPFEVGRAYTLVDGDEVTPAAVAAAIREGRVQPVYQESTAGRIADRVYEVVHRIRGHR